MLNSFLARKSCKELTKFLSQIYTPSQSKKNDLSNAGIPQLFILLALNAVYDFVDLKMYSKSFLKTFLFQVKMRPKLALNTFNCHILK